MKKILLLLLVAASLFSCKRKSVTINPAHFKYISAYTNGTISRTSNILLEFNSNVVISFEQRKKLDNSLLKFEPEIEGKLTWVNNSTLQFTPNEMLPSDQHYSAALDLKQLIDTIPDSLRVFEFEFKTLKQSMELSFGNLENIDNKELKWMRFNGVLTTADAEDQAKIEKTLSAFVGNKNQKIRWSHTSETTHEFIVDSIARKDEQQQLSMVWDGNAINIDTKGTQTFDILALGDFQLMRVSGQNDKKQEITLEFSDPIDAKQELEGLIQLGNYDMEYTVENNLIRVYPNLRLIGDIEIIVEAGIQNILGHKLQKRERHIIRFEEIKPEVKIESKGVIIPRSNQGTPFVFEAVNLSAVDVRVIKIFEKSIPQFLQVNDLAGSNELKRVGHVLFQKKIELDKLKGIDLKNWNKHVLDISQLVETEPGAIYEIAIGFKRSYSLYTCTDDKSSKEDSENMLEVDADWNSPDALGAEESSWDYYEEESYEENNSDWSNRDNPCRNEYYNSSRVVKRNVLASDIAIIAKKSPDNKLTVAVTDIQSTRPLSGVSIEIYNYQQHILKKVSTDANGIAEFEVTGSPFLLIASQGKQRGYLKLTAANALSLNRFDVQGIQQQKGINGFIYQERGVSRPGDSLYLTFLLEDKRKSLPENHPVLFELYDPQGQLVERVSQNKSVGGVYVWRSKTDENAITGNYMCKVLAGGSTFSKVIKIETVVPNRLKIKWSNENKAASNTNPNFKGNLNVNWLHGAPGANLKVDVSYVLTQDKTTFSRFKDFEFDDPGKSYAGEEQIIFEGNLDEFGKTTIQHTLTANSEAPGRLLANFKTRAYEPGGNFSTDRFSIPFHPFDYYVGLKLPKGDVARGMLLTDTNHVVQIATVDKLGNPVSDRTVSIKFYKLEWKWWWEKDNEGFNYNGRFHGELLQQGTAVSKEGIAKWNLRINYPEWGRYLVQATDADGHSCAKVIYMDWPGWAGRGQKENVAGASMLAFSSDKPSYAVGENITLSIPTGEGGRALVSIENGDRVLETYWVNSNKGTTQFTFKAKANMTPNIYASVTLLQPYQQTANDLPIRLFGTIPIKIINPATVLEPVITMPNSLRPDEAYNLSVSEKNNRAMIYTIAIVDEGLLDLTRFSTPDPWNYFYQKKALDIKTWDVFEDIVGAEKGQINSLLTLGGGDEVDDKQGGSKTNRFTPVVKFLGPFVLAPGEHKNHSINIQSYVGSVRTMVIARYADAYGYAEKATPVKKPLMVMASLPRTLKPEEEIAVPVNVFVLDKKIKMVEVSIATNNYFEVLGEKTKKLTFSKEGDQLTTFRIRVKKNVGTGSIKVSATSGAEAVNYAINLPILAPNPQISQVFTKQLLPGTNWQQNIQAIGYGGTNSATLEVSSVPPFNLAKRLDYLIQYPHGCIEQTTSSVFPQLFINDFVAMSPEMLKKIEKNINAAINRLSRFQVSQGGFAYWPGMGSADEWGSNYAGHFLLEAKHKGFGVPEQMMKKWLEFEKSKAKSWAGDDQNTELTQAYRLYLLALADNAELGAMNRMRLSNNLSSAARWYLAAAYKLAVKPEIAVNICQGLTTAVSDKANNQQYTYGSVDRDKAIVLHALTIIGGRNKEAVALAEELAKELNTDKEWMSTQTTAYCLFAMMQYKTATQNAAQFTFSYTMAQQAAQSVQAKKAVWQSELKISAATQILSVQNTSDFPLYAQVVNRGVPTYSNKITPASKGISVFDVNYFDDEGNPLDPSKVTQGSDVVVEVTITADANKNSTYNMALLHMFPSGWEIQNSRMDPESGTANSASVYQDIRDDRILTYYHFQNNTQTYRYKLNASYVGKFYLPTMQTEGMYDNTVQALIPGQWMEVVPK